MRSRLLQATGGQRVFSVVLSHGDEAMASLNDFVTSQGLGAASFTAIGAFSQAVLGYFDWERKTYERIQVGEQVEVASLIGDIALLDGKPVVHMHCVVALPDGETRGGHLLSAHVSPLLEVFVTADPVALEKKHDPATGLSLMDPGVN